MGTPTWFFRAARPRIVSHIGSDAGAVWLRSRFLYAVAWLLLVPVGLTACLWAEASGPVVLWFVAAASWAGGSVFAAQSIATASRANRIASAHLSSERGYRMVVSCPISAREWQWVRAIARAENEHASHIRLAEATGAASAVERLVEMKRQTQRVARVALGLVGFLVGLVVGLLLALTTGQTTSPGVLFVFIAASAGAVGVPRSLRGRFNGAVTAYRSDVLRELSAAQL